MWWFESTVDHFRGFNVSELDIDEAWLNISSTFNKTLWLYFLSSNCHECPFQKLLEEPILPYHSYRTKLKTQYRSTLRFQTSENSTHLAGLDVNGNDSVTVCEISGNFGEFGVYSIHAHGEQSDSHKLFNCSLDEDLGPVNVYYPIIGIVTFWTVICLLWHNASKYWSTRTPFEGVISFFLNRQAENAPLISNEQSGQSENLEATTSSDTHLTKTAQCSKLRSRREQDDSRIHQQEASTSSGECRQTQSTSNSPSERERIKSLDAFRGLSILIMIFADDGGGGYYFFQHCTWDGLYVADLAFPWFLWICGVCIPMSIHGRLIKGSTKWPIFVEILYRSIKLILLGIVVNTSTSSKAIQLENLRIPGVLQRFGLCYLIGSILYLFFCGSTCKNLLFSLRSEPGPDVENEPENQTRTYNFRDLKVSAVPWLIVSVYILLHTFIIFFLPVPNCPTGYFGPGGLHKNGTFPPECVGGAAGYMDRVIFGISHIYNRPTSQRVYGSGAFDPEGSLGILTSILQVWLGVQTGIILLVYKRANERLVRFLVWSVLVGFIGFCLCGGYSNQGWIPVNKNLWSLSFVLVTASAALLCLSLSYTLIDHKKLWSGRPLIETGMNSIFLYLVHEFCHASLPWHYSYGRMRTHFSRLVESTWGTALWIMLAMYLYNRQLFFIV